MDKRVAFITGGANGIGLCTAEYLLKENYLVFILDTDQEGLTKMIDKHYPNLQGYHGDVAKEGDVIAAFDQLRSSWGRLDLLFNNAGSTGPVKLAQDIENEEFMDCLSNILGGQHNCTRQAIPMMKAQQSGNIVNMTSTAYGFGFPYRSPYTAAKWGTVGLTKTWAMELGRDNITVNCVSPGCVDSDRIRMLIQKDADNKGIPYEQAEKAWKATVSMRTFVDAEEVASMVAYFGSPAAKRISGQVVAIDGHTEGLGDQTS